MESHVYSRCSSLISQSSSSSSSFIFFRRNPKFASRRVRIFPPIKRSLSISLSNSKMSHSVTVIPQERVTIENKHGEKLVGLLQEAGSPEIVILCHGFTSSKERPPMVNLATALEKQGISVFRFDFAGNGESEGTFRYGHYNREADDLRSVIEHFTGENRRIGGIFGHSKGGDVVLLYASRYQDISMVVNASGRYDLKRGIAERVGQDFMDKLKGNGFIDIKDKNGNVRYRVTEESMMDRLSTDMRSACLRIHKDCRVLTIHGSEDEIIPVEDAFEFSKVIPNHKLHIVEGADHGYTSHQTELASTVVDFIKSNLDGYKSSPPSS